MRSFYLGTALLVFSLASFAQTPNVAPGSVLNSASYAEPVVPGSLVAIFGTNLGSGLSTASSVPFSTNLGGTSVTFGDVAAPLHFVSATQINAQVPWNVTGATTNMVVSRNGTSSVPTAVPLTGANPGVYSLNGSGSGQALAFINPDYALAATVGLVPGLASRPARGSDPNPNNRDVLIIYASGLGAVDSPLANGTNSLDKLRSVSQPLQVLFGNVPATEVFFAGLAPEFVGVYQLNVRIPAGAPTGNAVPLRIVEGGITSTAAITIAIQ